jgi:hypothetical protein
LGVTRLWEHVKWTPRHLLLRLVLLLLFFLNLHCCEIMFSISVSCNVKALVSSGLLLLPLSSSHSSAAAPMVNTFWGLLVKVWGISVLSDESSFDSFLWPKHLTKLDFAGIWKRTHDCSHSVYFQGDLPTHICVTFKCVVTDEWLLEERP